MEMSENVEKNAKCTCSPDNGTFDPRCPEHGARAEIFDFPPGEKDLADILANEKLMTREFERRLVPLPDSPEAHAAYQSALEASSAPEPVPPADPAAAFVEAVVAVDRRAFTSTAEIMTAARAWCDDNGALPFGPRALAAQLKRRRGVQPHSNGQRRGWRGVKLR
jgi:hypothetical protein